MKIKFHPDKSTQPHFHHGAIQLIAMSGDDNFELGRLQGQLQGSIDYRYEKNLDVHTLYIPLQKALAPTRLGRNVDDLKLPENES